MMHRIEYAAEALTAAALISLPLWWHYAAAVLAALAGWL